MTDIIKLAGEAGATTYTNQNTVPPVAAFTFTPKQLGRFVELVAKQKRDGKTEFLAAFALGFMVTREGFNAECPLEHLAPSRIDSLGDCKEDNIPAMTKALHQNKEFMRLADEAWALQNP